MTSDFLRDDAFQRDIRDRILAPCFYGAFAKGGRYIFVDKGRLASVLQKRYAVDTFVQGKGGFCYCIEEKIVRWPKRDRPYTAYSLETNSCTKPGFESDGWMKYGSADFLLYGFHQPDDSLIVHLIDFPRLQEWFWPREDTFPVFGPLNTLNRSKGRVVSIDRVFASVPTWRRHIRSTEAARQAVETAFGCS